MAKTSSNRDSKEHKTTQRRIENLHLVRYLHGFSITAVNKTLFKKTSRDFKSAVFEQCNFNLSVVTHFGEERKLKISSLIVGNKNKSPLFKFTTFSCVSNFINLSNFQLSQGEFLFRVRGAVSKHSALSESCYLINWSKNAFVQVVNDRALIKETNNVEWLGKKGSETGYAIYQLYNCFMLK